MSIGSELFERAVAFPCDGETLVGIVASGPVQSSLGVVIVVGGPQYRAGSHRQFVGLARQLALHGFPTMRFDYRGMGDSSGDRRAFDTLDDDIRAAIDALLAVHPNTSSVALWGLCDAASAAMMYAANDARVRGLILANPWARGEETYARTQLKYYYARRLLSLDFWRTALLGKVNFLRAATELGENVSRAAGRKNSAEYRERMLLGLRRFPGRVLLIISGRDYTAREFLDFAASQHKGDALSGDNLTRFNLPESDHTFSQQAWKQRVAEITRDWLSQLEKRVGPATSKDVAAQKCGSSWFVAQPKS